MLTDKQIEILANALCNYWHSKENAWFDPEKDWQIHLKHAAGIAAYLPDDWCESKLDQKRLLRAVEQYVCGPDELAHHDTIEEFVADIAEAYNEDGIYYPEEWDKCPLCGRKLTSDQTGHFHSQEAVSSAQLDWEDQHRK